VEENQLTNLAVYPNPATDFVNIQQSEVALQKIEIYSMNGQLIRSENNNLEKINISRLKSGMYIMKLYAENTSKTIKLLRE
jgi:hypothetical protein